jgi:hypothetical protein
LTNVYPNNNNNNNKNKVKSKPLELYELAGKKLDFQTKTKWISKLMYVFKNIDFQLTFEF